MPCWYSRGIDELYINQVRYFFRGTRKGSRNHDRPIAGAASGEGVAGGCEHRYRGRRRRSVRVPEEQRTQQKNKGESGSRVKYNSSEHARSYTQCREKLANSGSPSWSSVRYPATAFQLARHQKGSRLAPQRVPGWDEGGQDFRKCAGAFGSPQRFPSRSTRGASRDKKAFLTSHATPFVTLPVFETIEGPLSPHGSVQTYPGANCQWQWCAERTQLSL